MYKLVVSNFDKTLIDDDGRIPLSTVLLLDELRRKNIKIVIATDRCLKSVIDYNKDFTIFDYLITSNGATIYDMSKEEVIYHKNIGIRAIKRIIKDYYDQAIIYLTDHHWNLISEKSAYEQEFDVEKITDKDKFIEENKNNIYQIELYFQNQKLARQSLKEIENSGMNIQADLIEKEGKFLIEITNGEASKFNGLKKVLKKEKIDIQEVIAFGYNYSDLELLQEVGLGVAVDNATKEVKNKAKETTTTNNLKGVEKFLKKIF